MISFPEIKRCIYANNPLVEVICQLRFPPILSIDRDVPYEFQDNIREFFPEFNQGEEVQIPIPGNSIDDAPSEIIDFARNVIKKKNYSFLSRDQKWKVNLTRDFISVSTLNYVKWEDFIERITPIIETFQNIYQPSYYSRIGLRYVDIIKRSKLGLEGNSWSELLKLQVLGLLGFGEFEENIDELQSTSLLNLHQINSKVRIRSGLVKMNVDDDENAFIFDSDFFTNEQKNIEDYLEKLEDFHHFSSPLFRFCLTEKLHVALEPEVL